jgi:hypothetical protein
MLKSSSRHHKMDGKRAHDQASQTDCILTEERDCKRQNIETGDDVGPSSTKAVALKFCSEGTSLDEVSAMSFEQICARLYENTVIDSSADMLSHIILLANCISIKINVKVFLAAYMIATHAHCVFEKIHDLEINVLRVARPMLECFHKTAAALGQGLSWAQVQPDEAQHLPDLLRSYLIAFQVSACRTNHATRSLNSCLTDHIFQEWKLADEIKIAGKLIKALCGVEKAQSALEDNNESSIRTELQAEQKRLREKLVQVSHSIRHTCLFGG